MFRTTICPSWREITVSMWQLVFVTLCGWMEWRVDSTLHTRQSYTQSYKYQVSHRYSYFSSWWAHSRPKHVEKRNKHIKKNCAPNWLYLQDFVSEFNTHSVTPLIFRLFWYSKSHMNVFARSRHWAVNCNRLCNRHLNFNWKYPRFLFYPLCVFFQVYLNVGTNLWCENSIELACWWI
jgi:hypothetical protein